MSCSVAAAFSAVPVIQLLLPRVVLSASLRPYPGNAVIAGNILSVQMDKEDFAKKKWFEVSIKAFSSLQLSLFQSGANHINLSCRCKLLQPLFKPAGSDTQRQSWNNARVSRPMQTFITTGEKKIKSKEIMCILINHIRPRFRLHTRLLYDCLTI